MAYNHLFSPFRIGTCEIPNRLVVPAMVANMNPDQGLATEQYIRYHEEKAKGGFGLIITEDYRINPHAGGYPHIAGLWNEAQVESHRHLTERIHKYGSKIFCQIYHAGRQASRAVNGGVQVVSCSPIPDPWNKELPRELSVDEIHELVHDFATTAKNVKLSGFDGVEIHAAHGYLIHEFLSQNCNKRTDMYGGSYENRARFLHEIMIAVREAVGPDFPISVRISAQEGSEGGRLMPESRMIMKDIEAWGADVLHVSAGMYGVRSSAGVVGSFFAGHGHNMKFAQEAKSFLHIPVITVGRITEPKMAEDIIKSGIADFVALGRSSLTDPHFPEKVRAGQYDDIRPCVGCLQGCTASTYQGVPLYCMVNPELGHEYEYDYSKTEHPKTILVAGGGVGGMEAARGAAIKGHKVHLYESTDTLGGQFLTASYPPCKGDFVGYIAWLTRQLNKLDVDIHMNTELTREIVASERPDKVIIATGSHPFVPELEGIHGANVYLAEDVLRGRADPGMNVVVAGAGMVGTETAAYLSVQCRSSVTILAKHEDVGMEIDQGIRDDLKDLLRRNFVKIRTRTKLLSVREDGAVIQQEGKEPEFYPCDGVVLAIGSRSYNPLEEKLRDLCGDLAVIGDARMARKAIEAVSEGFKAGFFA